MSWPQYDPAPLQLSTGRWWTEQDPPVRWWRDDTPFVHRDQAPVAAAFPELDLLGVADPDVSVLDLEHEQTALFYASGSQVSGAVLDGVVREQDLLDLAGAHLEGPVTAYDKRAVVSFGRVLRYWPQARGLCEPLTFFVPATEHGGDALVFETHWAPEWELPAAAILSARMGAPVLVGSRARPPAGT